MRGPRLGVRIGVDVGSVRVGVARSDPSGLLATPVATLARTAGDLPDVQDADVVTLAGIVHDEAAIEVVVVRICSTSWPVAWSRAPVGSSAKTTAGSCTMARAIATRWA